LCVDSSEANVYPGIFEIGLDHAARQEEKGVRVLSELQTVARNIAWWMRRPALSHGSGRARLSVFCTWGLDVRPRLCLSPRREASTGQASVRFPERLGQDGLAARNARLSFSDLPEIDPGAMTVTQSTQGTTGLVGNVYTWVDLSGFRAKDDGAARSYSGRGLQIGADMEVAVDTFVGLSFGVQDLSASEGANNQTGVLRFVQPYLANSSGAWEGEASLIIGRGDFDQVSGGGTGSGETRLTALTFAGRHNIVVSDVVTLTPTLDLTHGRGRIEGTGGTLVGAGTETVRFTEVSLGAAVSHAIAGGEIFGGLYADWLDTSADTQLVSNLLVDDGWTGRVALGVSTKISGGAFFDTSLQIEGLGGVCAAAWRPAFLGVGTPMATRSCADRTCASWMTRSGQR
jgi:hypothetical protein